MPVFFSSRILGAVLIAGLVAACAMEPKPARLPPPLEGAGLSAMLARVPVTRLNDPFLRAGIRALEEGHLSDASAGVNRALEYDPQNPHLHFLNGLIYHLRAEAGDSSQYEMAVSKDSMPLAQQFLRITVHGMATAVVFAKEHIEQSTLVPI